MPPDTARVLVAELIDYAGIYPPAGLDMGSAVRNHAAYLRGTDSWILGRLVVPVGRLGEFAGAAAGFLSVPAGTGTWRLTVVCGADLEQDLARILAFSGRCHEAGAGGTVIVDSVELRASGPAQITRASAIFPEQLQVYFEIPISDVLREWILAVRETGRRAKVRTGGSSEELFPAAPDLARFLVACRDADLPFKATAGLHHAIRSNYRLTYEPDSRCAPMHGFLNVFLAAAFVRAGMDEAQAGRLLEERSPAAFQFEDEQVRWRSHCLKRDQIRDARRNFAIAFGSCSFEEPVDDLRRLQLW